MTLIDADAVDRLRTAKNAETTRADKAESELSTLRSDYERLSHKWNELLDEPEYNDAAKMVKARKEQEARLAEEAKREEQARENRRQTVLDSIVTNGKKTNVTTRGSNGCADQLTNWDGTQKIGLGALQKKKRRISQ